MKIVLTGFMGSGKSTVAALLAERLTMPLIDMDSEIVRRAGGMSIPQIFDTFGETHFRDLESQVAASFAGSHSAVISTGGGTPERAENMRALKSARSCVVFLDVPFSTVQQRLAERTDRPLLRDPVKAQELHERRQKIYTQYADLIVSGEKTPEEICREIERFPGVLTQ